jgi:hypothetical protein
MLDKRAFCAVARCIFWGEKHILLSADTETFCQYIGIIEQSQLSFQDFFIFSLKFQDFSSTFALVDRISHKAVSK